MTSVAETVAAIVGATDWARRVALVRGIPEQYGVAAHRDVYAALARRLYVPQLTPDFAYVHWREEYELDAVAAPYRAAYELTGGFSKVAVEDVAAAVLREPRTTMVWRLLVGYTWAEFAAATEAVVAELTDLAPLPADRLRRLERGLGRAATWVEARIIAEVTARAVTGVLWPPVPDGRRLKQQRPDLLEGWDTVRRFATEGVPLQLLLHQRMYGGAFRQLLDATSSVRGDSLEDALAAELDLSGVRYLRTGSEPARDQVEVQHHSAACAGFRLLRWCRESAGDARSEAD